jgi:uncharacterized protein (TIGR00730 family)
MIPHPPRRRIFPSAHEDARRAAKPSVPEQRRSASYRLAYQDPEFLLRDELRPVRLQLELLKPELILQEHHIESTIVVYGSARIPDPDTAREELEAARARANAAPCDAAARAAVQAAERRFAQSRYYEEARRLGRLIGEHADNRRCVVTTGGGPGIMEAANRGASEAGALTIGLNIVLPHEQMSNPYITPSLNFQFHYFAIRKMHLLMRARTLVAFPGGFGTLDELFETLTLIQTGKVRRIPVLLFGREFWERVVDFQVLVDEGTIAPQDVNLFRYVDTAEEAWEVIAQADEEDRQNGNSRGRPGAA